MERNCLTCGGSLEGLHWSTRYCSAECKGPRKAKPPKEARGARSTELRTLRENPPPCESCGEPIPAPRLPAKYCADKCRQEAYAIRNSDRLRFERTAASQARAAGRRVPLLCEFCGQPFERRARNQRYCSKLCGQRGWAKENPEHYKIILAHSEENRHAKWIARRDIRPPCPMCGTTLPVERGPKAIYCSDTCNQHATYQRNRDKLLLRMRSYRIQHPEYFRRKAAERHDRLLAEDPEGYPMSLRLRALAWHRAHRDLVRQRARLRTLRNPGRGSIHGANYRARKAGAETFSFTERDWQRLLERFGHECAYCGEAIRGVAQKEHVIPLIRGGRQSVGNIVPACAGCNYSKGDLLVTEWRMREIRFGQARKEVS